MTNLWFPLIFIACYFFYLIPAIIAFNGEKKNKGWILFLDFFLGWSIVGYIAALIWACVSEKETA